MANFDFNFYTINSKFNGNKGQFALRIRNKSFDEAIKLAHRCNNLTNQIVKMEFDNLYVLYFDEHLIEQFLNKEILYEELIKQLQCTDIVINKTEFITDNGTEIDPGALWKRFDQKCILIDEDHYVECSHIKNLFQSVELNTN